MMKTSGIMEKADLMGILSIVLSVLGSALGYFVKFGGDSFGPGQIVAFIAVLLSLMSVKDKGRNILAMTAFFLSFVALFLAVGFGAVR